MTRKLGMPGEGVTRDLTNAEKRVLNFVGNAKITGNSRILKTKKREVVLSESEYERLRKFWGQRSHVWGNSYVDYSVQK